MTQNVREGTAGASTSASVILDGQEMLAMSALLYPDAKMEIALREMIVLVSKDGQALYVRNLFAIPLATLTMETVFCLGTANAILAGLATLVISEW